MLKFGGWSCRTQVCMFVLLFEKCRESAFEFTLLAFFS
jgi:hypothetical protein